MLKDPKVIKFGQGVPVTVLEKFIFPQEECQAGHGPSLIRCVISCGFLIEDMHFLSKNPPDLGTVGLRQLGGET